MLDSCFEGPLLYCNLLLYEQAFGHLLKLLYFVLTLYSASVFLLVYLDDCKVLYTLNLVPFGYFNLCDVLFN